MSSFDFIMTQLNARGNRYVFGTNMLLFRECDKLRHENMFNQKTNGNSNIESKDRRSGARYSYR